MTDPYTPSPGVTDPLLVAMSTISHQLAGLPAAIAAALHAAPVDTAPSPTPPTLPKVGEWRLSPNGREWEVIGRERRTDGTILVRDIYGYRTWRRETADVASWPVSRAVSADPDPDTAPAPEPEPDEDRDFAQSIAEYVQTSTVWESWSKEDVAREAVLVILGDESAGHRALDLLRRKVPAADLIDREAAIEAVIAALPHYRQQRDYINGWVSAREAIVAALRSLPGVTP